MHRILILIISTALQLTVGCVGGGDAVVMAAIGVGELPLSLEPRFVASAVHGRLLDNGAPVVNKTVKRRIHVLEWGDSIEQEAQTNHFGYFKWNEIRSKDLRKGIAKMDFQHEYLLISEGHTELFWAGTKYGNENLAEIFSNGNSVMLSGREFFKLDGERLYFEVDLADLRKM